MADYLLVDNFSQETSSFGTSWEGFTDQVMGGVSEMNVVRIPGPEGVFVRMTGDVSVENNGGFVQTRLKLRSGGGVFDGSTYKGIRVRVRGKGDGYYVFLRTSNTILPWKFFKARIPVSENWSEAEIPWSAFESGDYGRTKRFSARNLKSIAIVAYGKTFTAEMDIDEIGLYK